jgi:hypothetical protein
VICSKVKTDDTNLIKQKRARADQRGEAGKSARRARKNSGEESRLLARDGTARHHVRNGEEPRRGDEKFRVRVEDVQPEQPGDRLPPRPELRQSRQGDQEHLNLPPRAQGRFQFFVTWKKKFPLYFYINRNSSKDTFFKKKFRN